MCILPQLGTATLDWADMSHVRKIGLRGESERDGRDGTDGRPRDGQDGRTGRTGQDGRTP